MSGVFVERDSGQQPFLIPKPRCFGVRCPGCGAYMALEEVRGEGTRCTRLDQPAWIVCVGCGVERLYSAAHLIQFDWPPVEPA